MTSNEIWTEEQLEDFISFFKQMHASFNKGKQKIKKSEKVSPPLEENAEKAFAFENQRMNRNLYVELLDNAATWAALYKKFGRVEYKERADESFKLSKKFKI